MNENAVAYFEQKFATFDREELGNLVARRDDLSDEAVEALERVLTAKGLTVSDVIEPIVVPLPIQRTPDEEVRYVAEEQVRSSRELWQGKLSKTCNVLVGVIFMLPAMIFARKYTLGGLFTMVLLLAFGYYGFWQGRKITGRICNDANISIQAKRQKLRKMFALLWPIYFFVYVLFSLLVNG
jgi:hypothetical protein